MAQGALPGFRDFYPDDFAQRAYITRIWRAVARRYAFVEYDGPPLESLELYTKKSGEEIVGQLYNFVDKGGREVALRPEMTPTLARMIAAKANAMRKPVRWFSIPQLFRYERQQRGRLREHFQLNMDVIGEPGPAADAEVMAAALDIMRAFGLGPGDVRLRVSDRRVIAGKLTHAFGVAPDELTAVLGALDKWERAPQETERLLGTALRADPGRIRPVLEFISGLRQGVAELRESPAAQPLNECVQRLGAMGLDAFVDVEFTIVRGLAYYTGIVFELFDAGKALRAICGGGRYDDLIREMAGVDLPCVGFGMGDVVLGELLQDRDRQLEAPAQLDAFLIAVSGEDVSSVLKLAHDLRDRGVAVGEPPRHPGLRQHLRLAAARGAPRAVIIGPDERKAGAAVVRDLRAGTEEQVPFGTLL